MSRGSKIWTGVLTFLPIILSFIVIGLIIKNFVGLFGLALADASAEAAGEYILKDYIIIISLSVLLSFLNLIQMIIFIVFCIKNTTIENNGKILYVVFLILFTNITAVVYFFVEIIGEKSNAAKNKEKYI